MKIYSYKIKINNSIQKDIQSYPFINSKDKKINEQVINYLKSGNLEVNEKEIDNKTAIINWDNIDEEFSYEALMEKIKIFKLENIISEKLLKNAYSRLNWKFEKINFNKKKS